MKLSELLSLDIHSNISCEWCEKSMIVKEAYIEGVDEDNVFVLCDFCEQYKNYDRTQNKYNGSYEDVKEGINEIFEKTWSGLEPLPIWYI